MTNFPTSGIVSTALRDQDRKAMVTFTTEEGNEVSEEWQPWTRNHFEIKRLLEAQGLILVKCWFQGDTYLDYYDSYPPEEVVDYFHGKWTVQAHDGGATAVTFTAKNMTEVRARITQWRER